LASAWLGIGGVLTALAGLIALAHLGHRSGRLSAEAARKLIHAGMGAALLALPWLFEEAWPALVLAVAGGGGLLALGRWGRWRDGLGRVLCDPRRPPWGQPCYAAGGLALFVLYLHADGVEPGRRLALFVVPALLLSLPDAAAALVGTAWGRHHFGNGGVRKSVEGSAAFLLCALPCVLLPLLLLTQAAVEQALLAAVLVAYLAALVEAITGYGLDNLTVPLAGYWLLRFALAPG
jgi:phytol kinase